MQRRTQVAHRAVAWVLAGVVAATAGDAAAHMSAEAARVVDRLETAMGGAEDWNRVRYLRFDWAVERDGAEQARVRHLWDRQGNRYRVEWKTREGQAVQALFDTMSRAGRVWVDGVEATGEDATKHLERAYGRFINDTYWLLMPWKLRDPGVHVELEGEQALDGKTYDLLHVSFENVGLTPGDHYWAYVDRETGRMDRWAFFLESDKEKGEPSLDKASAWTWSEWRKVGDVMLACDRRVAAEGGRRIHFPVVATPGKVDARVFADVTVAMPEPATGH